MHIGYIWKSQKKYHLEDQDEDGLIILNCILERCNGVLWTGLIWLGIGTSGEFLCTW
jgi:hypothetical protein